jgi:TolB protein
VSDRDGDYEIYVMNADGSGQTNITSAPGLDIAPKWSPDGSRIVFESDRNGISEIYVMNADGSGQKNLTTALSDGSNAPGETDADPTWSPDSSRIAFWSERDGNQDIYNQDVYVMKADGSERRRLTDDPAGDNSPRWQPTPAP